MNYWIGLLCGVVLLLVIVRSSFAESFTAAEEGVFVEQQRAVPTFDQVPVSPGVNLQGINGAMNTADGTLLDYRKRFRKDPMSTFRAKDEATCRLARHPRQLSRADTASYGCGWWFVPNGISIGTLGTATGPADLSVPDSAPTGTWVWNLTDAARMEDIKLCKQITLCEAATAECGWCESQGHAVPIGANGAVAYPTDDDGSCSTTPLVGTCPAPPDPPSVPVLDSDGNIIGEKTLPSSGSTCTPVNGVLSKACLLALAASRGCQPSGALYQLIARGGAPSLTDSIAIDILSNANVVNLTPDLYGGGAITTSTALAAYTALVNAIVSGRTTNIQQAARYLAVGGAAVDVCDVGDATMGPFSTDCLGRAFRTVGCQPSGSAYPSDPSFTTGATWGNVKLSYALLADSMHSTDAFAQADSIQKCLGTSVNLFAGIQ